MPPTKGFVDTLPSMWESGEMHRLQLSGVQKRMSVEGSIDPSNKAEIDSRVEALSLGRPVISEAFAPILGRVTGQEVYPDKTIDESRSAHQVSFGRFVGRRSHKPGVSTVLSVAYKPFDNPDDALQEFNGYLLLRDIGVPTFEPVGVFPSAGKEHFITVTKKRDDLMSLDRDDWVVGRQPTTDGELEIAERNTQTVKDIAGTMAHLHANRVFHPDGQIKNFAITQDGKVGVIDTENLYKTQVDGSMLAALAWEDVEKLVKSLIIVGSEDGSNDKIFGVGMLGRMQLPMMREACEELIFTPYLKGLEKAIEVNPDDEDNLSQLGISLVERFQNEAGWPEFLV